MQTQNAVILFIRKLINFLVESQYSYSYLDTTVLHFKIKEVLSLYSKFFLIVCKIVLYYFWANIYLESLII